MGRRQNDIFQPAKATALLHSSPVSGCPSHFCQSGAPGPLLMLPAVCWASDCASCSTSSRAGEARRGKRGNEGDSFPPCVPQALPALFLACEKLVSEGTSILLPSLAAPQHLCPIACCCPSSCLPLSLLLRGPPAAQSPCLPSSPLYRLASHNERHAVPAAGVVCCPPSCLTAAAHA